MPKTSCLDGVCKFILLWQVLTHIISLHSECLDSSLRRCTCCSKSLEEYSNFESSNCTFCSKICKACPKGVWLALTTTAGDVKVPPALIRMSRITWGQQQRKCVDERTLTSIPSIGKRQGYPALHGSHFGRPFCPKSSKTRIRNHGKFSNVNIKSAVLCRQHGPPNILPREEPCSTEMGKLCARRTVDIQRCITRPQIGVETLRCLMRV